jgi:hypothetical protein
MPVRARFVLVVSDLKPVLRAGSGRSAVGKYDTISLAWGESSRDWQLAGNLIDYAQNVISSDWIFL